jgi:hypothetical protein
LQSLRKVVVHAAMVLGTGVLGCGSESSPEIIAPTSMSVARELEGDSAAVRDRWKRLTAVNVNAMLASARCQLPGTNWYAQCATITMTATPLNAHCSFYCSYPGMVWPDGQREPITIVFSKPIFDLVAIGSGAQYCLGTWGTLLAYNANGALVENANLQMYDGGSDCPPDDVTGGSIDTLAFKGGIIKIEILPPSPWEFPVPTPGGGTVTGFITAHYSYLLSESRPVDSVNCPTGIPLLDKQTTRELLDSLYRLAGGDSVPSQKIERGGYLYEDSTGLVKFKILPPGPLDTGCETQVLSNLTPPSDGMVLALVHIHPWWHGDTVTVCHPSYAATYNANKCRTFSCAADLDSRLAADAAKFGPGFEGAIVMDRENIAYAPRGTTSKNFKQPAGVKELKRQQPGCQIA